MKVFVLEKKDQRFSKVDVWKRQGIFFSYKGAQAAFIDRDGLFRIIEEEVQG